MSILKKSLPLIASSVLSCSALSYAAPISKIFKIAAITSLSFNGINSENLRGAVDGEAARKLQIGGYQFSLNGVEGTKYALQATSTRRAPSCAQLTGYNTELEQYWNKGQSSEGSSIATTSGQFSSGTFTAPVTGVYKVCHNLNFDSRNDVRVVVRVGGATISALTIGKSRNQEFPNSACANAILTVGQSITFHKNLDCGDYDAHNLSVNLEMQLVSNT